MHSGLPPSQRRFLVLQGTQALATRTEDGLGDDDKAVAPPPSAAVAAAPELSLSWYCVVLFVSDGDPPAPGAADDEGVELREVGCEVVK